MLRSPPQRPVSPANTTFSGISSYRSEAYRTRDIGGKNGAPSVPTIDARIVAKTHFEELTSFLASHVSKETQNSRSNARDKLTKLTTQQFQELSTDVYDELLRRKNNSSRNEVPFLPVRDDFHPRRNQAREKLATLPQLRFKDLSSDVYYELGRRYPEFKEEILIPVTPASPGSAYEESNPPSAQPRSANPATPEKDEMSMSEIRRRPSQSDSERPQPPSSYNNNPMPPPFRRPSQDDGPGLPTNPYRRPSQSENQRSNPGSGAGGYGPNANSTSSTATRRPSRGASDRDKDRDTITSPLLSATQGQSPVPTTAKSGIVIPNKSTMAEEDPIDIPFGETPASGSVPSARSAYSNNRDTDVEESESDYGRSPKSPEQGGGGLSGLSARLGASSRGEPQNVDSDIGGGPTKSSDEYYDKMSFGRTSVASDRSGGAPLSRNASKVSDRDREDLKREYEFKIATLQKKVGAGDERAKLMEEELRTLRERAEDHGTAMRALQRELDELKASREKERRQMEDEFDERDREVRNWQKKYEQANEDARKASNEPSEDHVELIEQLRGDTEGLIAELTDLQTRNEELANSKEECENAYQEAEDQAKEWKRKYESAKTELRGLKATSQLFLQTPEFEDAQSIPVNSEGGVLDIHLTSFQSAIDSLITIARSPAPAKVLTPMKTVVDATSAMLDDVRAYERRPPRGADLESVRALYERLEDTLSNLVIAAKNHAQSYGLSPVSLLDAAASHVSATVVELAKCVYIRRSTKAEQEAFASSSSSGPSLPVNLNLTLGTPMSPNLSNGFSPKLRSVDELRGRSASGRQRNGSVGSSLRGEMSPPPSAKSGGLRSAGSGTNGMSSAKHRQAPSDPSSSAGSVSPPIFDTPLATSNANAVASDESGLPDNPDDAWAELRPYLEAQSEQLVYAIQSVLSAVRAPVPPVSLNEHLTQVITIVASIVAVCKDSLPPSTSGQTVNQLLRDLSENCDKLSELQAQEKTKETRQSMAKASFAVANAMKLLLRI